MCGIVGIAGYGDVSLIHLMNQSQYHRGPDDGGIYADIECKVYLAMRRLSIVDITDGQQPMSNREGNVCIVFNGEIVNAPELRKGLIEKGAIFSTDHSDTEVLIHLYDEYGVKMLEHLNGMFAFVLHDRRRNILFGARDRFGIKPLYYSSDTNGFVFASELKTLRKHLFFDSELDRQSVYHYLSFQCIPAPNTVFKGISKLQAAYYFTYDIEKKRLELLRYWFPKPGVSETLGDINSYTDINYIIRSSFTEALDRWMLSDIPIACSLSGGIDSSIIAGLMSEHRGTRIRTYTLGFEGHHDIDERSLARTVSKRWDTIHTEIVLNPMELITDLDEMVKALDEPYGGGLPSWFVYKRMSGEVKVCMNGTGGDELFGNYGKWKVYEEPVIALRHAVGLMRQDLLWINDLIRYPYGSRYPVYFKEYEKRYRYIRGSFHSGCISSEELIENLLKEVVPSTKKDIPRIIDMQVQLPEEFLHMTDRFSMHFSIESRPPFLDFEFHDTMMRIPAVQRFGKGNLKHRLIDAFSDYIPDVLKSAPKKGFILPVADWMRKDLREVAEGLFNPTFLTGQGIFRDDVYHRLFLPFLNGDNRNTSRIWTIFMFQLWYSKNCN